MLCYCLERWLKAHVSGKEANQNQVISKTTLCMPCERQGHSSQSYVLNRARTQQVRGGVVQGRRRGSLEEEPFLNPWSQIRTCVGFRVSVSLCHARKFPHMGAWGWSQRETSHVAAAVIQEELYVLYGVNDDVKKFNNMMGNTRIRVN